jgi:hypothetical protein
MEKQAAIRQKNRPSLQGKSVSDQGIFKESTDFFTFFLRKLSRASTFAIPFEDRATRK